MQQNPGRNLALPIYVMLSVTAAALTIVVFWGWMSYGSAILLSAGETALSWCF